MRRARPLLGTIVEIEAKGVPTAPLQHAIDAAFEAVGRVHRLMSFHDEDSDVSRINRHAAAEGVPVDAWTIRVLRRARTLFEATSGLFDCVVGFEMMQNGRLPSRGLNNVVPGTSRAVEFLPDDRIRLSAPVAIDLGGIAKGFAVDRAIATLRRNGIHDAVVNAGGDMRVIGESPRTIHVRSTDPESVLWPSGTLQNGAIASSETTGTIVRATRLESRSREPTRNGAKAVYSVVAPNCLLADALTKVLVQTEKTDHPCLAQFGAIGVITSVNRQECRTH